MSDDNLPPTVRGLSFRLGWPPVEVVEDYEHRSVHGMMSLAMGAAAILAVVRTDPVVLAAAAIIIAFIAGYAFHTWLVFDDLYDDPAAAEEGSA